MSVENGLLRAVYGQLLADAALVSMVGAEGIRDRMVARAALPCIVFGEIDSREVDGEGLQEHFFVLEVWSLGEGRREVQEIAGRVREVLHDAALDLLPDLQQGLLVSLLHRGTRVKREPRTRFQLAEMRFRAVTEPASGLL